MFDHLLPLAFVFDGFFAHFCIFTNSVVSGQDDPKAVLMIFLYHRQMPGNFTRIGIRSVLLKKALIL